MELFHQAYMQMGQREGKVYNEHSATRGIPEEFRVT